MIVKTAILAGPGLSIKTADWGDLPDAPVAAVNSAVKYVPRLRWLIFCDRAKILSRLIGKAFVDALADTAVNVVQPHTRRNAEVANTTNVSYIERLQGPSCDRKALEIDRHQLDGRAPVFWASGMTTTFAVEVLVHKGIERIIFVGHDLEFEGLSPHADGAALDNTRAHRSRRSYEMVYGVLKSWSGLARRNGLEFYCYGKGRLLDFMPPWDGDNSHA